MALTIWTFFGAGSAPVSQQVLTTTREMLLELSPAGSRVDTRALDQHYMVLEASRDADASRLRFADELGSEQEARLAATIWLPDELEDPELRAVDTIERLHGLDPEPVTSAVCDSRIHLDLVGDDEPPKAYVVVSVTRAANITRDEYMWYYRAHHVPQAKALRPLFVRYSTHRVLYSRGDFAQDNITVQEYKSMEEVDRHVRKRVENASMNDQANFLSKVDYYAGDRALL
jgi:hypothetical protein